VEYKPEEDIVYSCGSKTTEKAVLDKVFDELMEEEWFDPLVSAFCLAV